MPGRQNIPKRRLINMSDIKSKANKKINAAADAAKKITSTVVDKTKDAAHAAGQKLQDGGKRLKDV
jgi:hypothetical protein